MNTTISPRLQACIEDEMRSHQAERERAERAAYSETRDRLPPPAYGGGLYLPNDAEEEQGELLTAIIGRWWRGLVSRGWEELTGDALGVLAFVGMAAFLAWFFWLQVGGLR